VRPADPLLTSDQAAMSESLDALCSKLISDDYLRCLDEEVRYPYEVMDALAAGGWAELCVPEADGGQGASAQDLCVLLETVASHSLAVAQSIYSLWIMGAEALARLGTDAQRARWLPGIVAGTGRIALAITEPGSGSDAAGLRMTAVPDGDGFLVTGQKVFITGAAICDVIVTAVRTSAEQQRQKGISLLLIEPGTAGVTVRKIPKMGLKALDLCEVFFDGVSVPDSALLGGRGAGWAGLQPGLAKERLLLAAIATGALQDVLARCTEYAGVRTAFGRPIATHQLITDKLVRMRVALETARALVRRAAELTDLGHPSAAAAASMAKLTATTDYISACREGVQVFGGYGFTDEYQISRHYRDCKYLEIGGGTSEVQKIVIARSMGIRA